MTESKNIGTNLDLHENEIKNARIPNIVGGEHENVAIPKKYVDDNNKLNTTTSTSVVNATTKVGGINIGDTVHNVTFNELLSNILFERIKPTYILPVLNFDITNLNSIVKEVGTSVNLDITSSVVNNDSQGGNGSNPFTLYSDVLTSNIIDSSMNRTINVELRENTIINLDYSYLGALTKNDNLGTPDNTGIFPSGTLTKTINIDSKFPYYYGLYSGDQNIPTNSSEIKSITNKVVDDINGFINIATLTPNAEQTLLVAVPYISDSSIVFTMNGYNITSGFDSGIVNYQTGSIFRDYQVFKLNTGIGVSQESIITIKRN